MINIHEWNTTDFSGNGQAALINATDVCLEREVNGECSLSFVLPPTDSVWKYVKEEAIAVLDGQAYRIRTIDGTSVTAYPVYQDACGYHIQSTGDFIGTSGYTIMQKLFKNAGNVKVLEPNAVSAFGLEPICGDSGTDDLIDFFEQSKITPVGALKYLQEQLNKNNIHNELFFDNYNIALVKKLGADKGARIDLRLNAASIKPKRDTTELITKLYPYGSGDMHIGSVTKKGFYNADGSKATSDNYCYRILNDGDQFIVSPYVDNYPVHEGHMSFDDIDNPTELIKMAALQFKGDNPERIDVPSYTVEVGELVKIGVPIALGDIVEVNDPQFNVKTKQRVVSQKIYPFEPEKDTVTVGKPEMSLFEMFGGALSKTVAMTNADGKVKSAWLENIKNAYRTEINNSLSDNTKEGRSVVVHEYGDIWVNPNNSNQALAIIGGQLAIANGKLDNGDWNWTAFGDWSGFTADKLVGGTIYTSLIHLMGDEKAKMEIKGDLITFKDSDEKIRAKWGYDDGKYIFEMYDADSNKNTYLDSNGNLCVTGELDTRKENEGQSGYLISGSAIHGQKYTANGYVNHGFVTGENEYGSHLSLYKDGVEHLHVIAHNDDNGNRTVYFSVNNSGDDQDGEVDSYYFLEATEGSVEATTKPYGTWIMDRRDNNFTIIANGYEAFNGQINLASDGGVMKHLFFENGILYRMT